MRGCLPVVVLLSIAFGCGEERADTEAAARTEDSPRPPPPHGEGAAEEGGAEREDPAPARLVRIEGAVTVDGAAARAGEAIEAEEPIEVPEDGRAVIQLLDGGRVELDGGGRARIVGEGAAQVFLTRGGLYAVQPPAGNAPRPPLRVVSPSATVEIGQAGELYLALFENGASWIAVLGGGVSVSTGEADVRRTLRTVDLTRGQAVAVPGRIMEPTEAPSRLTAARAAARELAAAEGTAEVDPERMRREVGHEVERLDQALRWLETETRRGRELTSEHRAAVRDGQADEAQRLQNELVEHSRSLYRLRRLATARWERLRVQQLRLHAVGAAQGDDPVSARRDRVVGLLGL